MSLLSHFLVYCLIKKLINLRKNWTDKWKKVSQREYFFSFSYSKYFLLNFTSEAGKFDLEQNKTRCLWSESIEKFYLFLDYMIPSIKNLSFLSDSNF